MTPQQRTPPLKAGPNGVRYRGVPLQCEENEDIHSLDPQYFTQETTQIRASKYLLMLPSTTQ